ncbi:MAG: hypothetical protein BWK80_21105 [Desulfobacteraceae bacterium IS3]|nr:MAG: hypothetical protein BWK80_21105 [Desulfobacteraceae bacterium IS3]
MVKLSTLRGKVILFLLMAMILTVPACGDSGSKPSGSPQPIAGGEFNRFFPKDSGDFDVVFTQEKAGMSQAKLKKSGREVAMLTISDLSDNPSAADKFKSSSASIAGYPAASSGGKGTAVLVENRFQVQVRSQADDFTQQDRESWLGKFDLTGLARLKNK